MHARLPTQGDTLAAAACGLTTGYVQGARQDAGPPALVEGVANSPSEGASSTAPQQAGRDWGFAARGLSNQDVHAVERHMMQLLDLPGLCSSTGCTTDSGDTAIDQQLQQAELKVSSMQHPHAFNTLPSITGCITLQDPAVPYPAVPK